MIKDGTLSQIAISGQIRRGWHENQGWLPDAEIPVPMTDDP
jgi:hypothetical protein